MRDVSRAGYVLVTQAVVVPAKSRVVMPPIIPQMNHLLLSHSGDHKNADYCGINSQATHALAQQNFGWWKGGGEKSGAPNDARTVFGR